MTPRNDGRHPEQIQHEAETTRAEMAETLDAVERRLSPRRLQDRALDYVRTERGRSQLGELIRRNPLPLTLIGIGLAWLVFAEQSRRQPYRRGYRTGAGYGRRPRRPAVTAVEAASRDHLVAWLRDAHAMEHQAIEMLEKQASRLEHYPELQVTVRDHLAQTRRQAERVAGCLERLGAGTSGLKDRAGQLTGTAQQLSGLFASDEVVKSGIADYAFERYEIAAYQALIATAEAAGEPEIVAVCRENLREEEAMAAWLAEHLPQVARQYLTRETTGQEAKT